MCDGYQFRENVEYVVYATNSDNQSWDVLRRFSDGRVVYEVGDCHCECAPMWVPNPGAMVAVIRPQNEHDGSSPHVTYRISYSRS